MTMFRAVALLGSMLPWVAGCRRTPEAKAAQVHAIETTRERQLARRIAMADAQPSKQVPLAMWLMPPALREISGLALTPNGDVLAHDDEVGRVYEIDPRTGIILKGFALNGLPHGDFEGITIAGKDIYLLESNGTLYRFNEGADGQQVPYTKYDTRLGHECEFESVAFEADSSRLLLACKKVSDKNLKKELLIYRVRVPLSDTAAVTLMAVPMADVIGSNPWKTFRPSDMTIEPMSGDYVLIASQQRGYAVVTPEGEVVRSGPLPAGHFQAEGVAITKDSILILSDETTHRPADITLYRWRP